MLEGIRARPGKVLLASDGRSDSPVHCVIYGSYSILEYPFWKDYWNQVSAKQSGQEQ